MPQTLKKLKLLVLTSTFSLINQKISSGRFLDKSSLKAANYADQNIGHGRNIAFDMSSPNIAKPFSIGHLRSTVIADALANIVAKQGYKPVRINHLGAGVNSLVC